MIKIHAKFYDLETKTILEGEKYEVISSPELVALLTSLPGNSPSMLLKTKAIGHLALEYKEFINEYFSGMRIKELGDYNRSYISVDKLLQLDQEQPFIASEWLDVLEANKLMLAHSLDGFNTHNEFKSFVLPVNDPMTTLLYPVKHKKLNEYEELKHNFKVFNSIPNFENVIMIFGCSDEE